MEQRQAYKFALRPNGEQALLMRRTAGCVRFVYNKALALQKEMYELTGKKHSRFQLDKLLTHWKTETPWLSEVPAHALQQALVDLDNRESRRRRSSSNRSVVWQLAGEHM